MARRCRAGHEVDGPTEYVDPDGASRCVPCQRAAELRSLRRRQLAARGQPIPADLQFRRPVQTRVDPKTARVNATAITHGLMRGVLDDDPGSEALVAEHLAAAARIVRHANADRIRRRA